MAGKSADTALKMAKVEEPAKPFAKPFRFGFLVHDVSRMRRTLFDQVMKPLDVTRSQWQVLAWLSRGGNDGVMQVDLARQLDVGKVKIGGLVDRLDLSGFVKRQPGARDGRVKRVFITPTGYELIHKMETLGGEKQSQDIEWHIRRGLANHGRDPGQGQDQHTRRTEQPDQIGCRPFDRCLEQLRTVSFELRTG